jgi:hypothetical protein
LFALSPSPLSLPQVRAAHLEVSAAAVTVGGLLGRGKSAAVYAAEVLGLCEGTEETAAAASARCEVT